MSVIAIIPARYASTRFEGKPLVDLCGQTMIERVWRATKQAKTINRVVVATEDERISKVCHDIGAECVMTSPDLPSGTDRVAAALSQLDVDAEIVLNVQGDEPLLHASVLDALVEKLRSSNADVATPIRLINTYEELINPTVCKVTLRSDSTALYFSRSVIPHVRGVRVEEWLQHTIFWKHIGIYAYRVASLRRFIELPVSDYETAESLEQLRLLADGARFVCVPTTHDFIAIDTPEDAERVRSILLTQS